MSRIPKQNMYLKNNLKFETLKILKSFLKTFKITFQNFLKQAASALSEVVDKVRALYLVLKIIYLLNFSFQFTCLLYQFTDLQKLEWLFRYQNSIFRANIYLTYYHATYEVQSESTLYSLPECQRTPCSKQASYLKFK